MSLFRSRCSPFSHPSLVRSFAARSQPKAAEKSPRPQRYHLDNRVWQLPPQPKKRWSLLQGLRIRINGVVSLFREEQELRDWRKMPKAAYYAVKSGREPGIYSTWSECEQQVKGFTSAKYKKFASQAEAEAFVGASTSFQAAPIKNKPTEATVEKSDDYMLRSATSPLTEATIASLPPHLVEIAKSGFAFTTAPHHLIVYTDGSALSNGMTGARAGLGVYYGYGGEAQASNISERVPGETQTNNRGELLSVIRALEDCPYPDLPLEIRTDSQYTIKCMTGWLAGWISKEFRGVKNTDMIKHMLVLLRRRGLSNKVVFKYVAGHTGEIGNEAADQLARRGALNDPLPDRDDWLNPDDVVEASVPEQSEVMVEVDESWLLTADDLAELEKEFA